jgi:glycosyltransferase involved in cell wall biosynthesis
MVLGLPWKKTVLTIHDCFFVEQHKGVKKWLIHHIVLKWPVLASRIVTTISEQSKNDIIKYTGCKPEKIRVINNPLAGEIYYKPKPFNTTVPVLLFLGSTPNKNLERVMEAIKGLDCVLDVVGMIKPEHEEKLKQYNIDYRQASRLSELELADKYYGCDILLFPTLAEGFGLPIIEAQKAGRVVLTSNISPMKDVAGGAGCLVDPYNENSIREGITKILQDEHYRHTLINQGFENIKRFELEAVVKQYYSVYKEIIGE